MKRLIAVPTCHQYAYHDAGAAHRNGRNELRSNAIRQTWYNNWKLRKEEIDLKFFYGHFPSEATRCPNPDEIFLDIPDDYPNLPAKVQKTFQWALDQGYDYVLKVDDDVYVYIDALLAGFDPNIEYIGCTGGDFISGAAYWISRRAMEFIVNEPWTSDQWAEDRFVGRTLGKHGITPTHDDRFQVCACDICLKKFPPESRITLHTTRPEMMFDQSIVDNRLRRQI